VESEVGGKGVGGGDENLEARRGTCEFRVFLGKEVGVLRPIIPERQRGGGNRYLYVRSNQAQTAQKNTEAGLIW